MKLILILILTLFVISCGRSEVSRTGSTQSCTITQTNTNTLIECPDGTTASVSNGTNGTDGSNGTNSEGACIAYIQENHYLLICGDIEIIIPQRNSKPDDDNDNNDEDEDD